LFKKIFSYAAWLYSLSMIASAVSFLVTLYMARIIQKAELGKYAIYVAIYSLSGAFLTSGMDRTFVKFVGEENEDYADLVALFLLFTLCFATLFLAIGLLLSPFLDHEIWMGIVAIGPFICTYNAACIFRGRLEQTSEVKLILGISFLNSLLTITFLSFYENEWAPILGDFLSLLIPSIVLIYVFFRRVGNLSKEKILLANNHQMVKRFFKFVRPLWFAGVAFSINNQLTSFLIKAFLNYKSLGEFYFAQTMLMLIHKPIDTLSKVLLAGFSIKREVDLRHFRTIIGVNLLLFPILAIFVINVLPFLIMTIGLEQYGNADFYVTLFVLSLPLMCIQALMGIVNVVFNMPEVSQKSYIFSTVVCAPTSVALIYYFGVPGAAIVPSLYALVLFFVNVFLLRNAARSHAFLSLKMGMLGEALYGLSLVVSFYYGNFFTVWLIIAAYVFCGHICKIWNLSEIYAILTRSLRRDT